MIKEEKCCQAPNCTRTSITHKDVCYRSKYDMILCGKHVFQFARHGKFIEQTRFEKNKIIINDDYAEIFFNNNKGNISCSTIIDIEDVDKISHYKWFKKKDDRVVCNIVKEGVGKSHIRLHNIIMDFDEYNMFDKMVDHIDKNPLNNRKSNLRIVNAQVNSTNRRMQKNNTSGVTGVVLKKSGSKYVSQIKFNSKMIRLLHTSDFDEAVKARLKAEIEYFKENSINYDTIRDVWRIEYLNLDSGQIKSLSINRELIIV